MFETRELKVDDPATGATYATAPLLSPAGFEAAIGRAAAAQRGWREVPVAERVGIVERFLERFLARREEVARDVTGQMGKPIVEARREVDTMADRARYLASIAASALADEVLPEKEGFERRVAREPLGVVLDVVPWNYPLLTAVNVVVPAVLAGNAVLVKPSPRTPLSAEPFERAFVEAGAPEGLVQSALADHETVDAAIADPRIGFVSLTGSVRAGRDVYVRAAEGLKPCGLELGGKDPAYVAADADLDFAAANVVEGATYNAGQSCCAVERVYVHEDVAEAFLERALAAVRSIRMGDPGNEGTTLGPLALPGSPERIARRIEAAVRSGARLLSGGRAVEVGGRGRYLEPALLAGVPPEAEIAVEETFGPVVPVIEVAGDEEALERMNDSRYGLTASIWTADRARAERFARDLETGTVFMNRCDVLDPALPWVGVKESGLGCTLGRLGFLQLSRPKSWHFRLRTR